MWLQKIKYESKALENFFDACNQIVSYRCWADRLLSINFCFVHIPDSNLGIFGYLSRYHNFDVSKTCEFEDQHVFSRSIRSTINLEDFLINLYLSTGFVWGKQITQIAAIASSLFSVRDACRSEKSSEGHICPCCCEFLFTIVESEKTGIAGPQSQRRRSQLGDIKETDSSGALKVCTWLSGDFLIRLFWQTSHKSLWQGSIVVDGCIICEQWDSHFK